ncbi:hypothetical protein AB1K70_05810 [Bremerella sp. JC770]|uniref:hypothetical protein n=1 Tax=Bremerella sp. JC770 TaxID=3232137 RepID=UPI0034582CD5
MRQFLIIAFTLALLVFQDATPHCYGAEAQDNADIELILVTAAGPSLVRLKVAVDRTPVTEAWEKAFAEIHYFFDRDGNGSLDRQEVSGRLLSDFVMRQWAWGQFTPTSGRTPQWDAIDQDRSGEVSVEELSGYYRSRGLGRGVITIGYPAWTLQLTEALVRIVDTDSDGTTTRQEWENIGHLLKQHDANGDDLIGPGELVLQAVYPGASGSILLNPTSLDRYDSEQFQRLPALVPEPSDISPVWPKELLRRLDANGNLALSLSESGMDSQLFTKLDGNHDQALSISEIAHWRDLADAKPITVAFSDNTAIVSVADQADGMPEANLPYRLLKDGLQLSLMSSPGNARGEQIAAEKRLSAQFDSIDADKDGRATSEEIANSNLLEFARMKTIADRDGDGVLVREEFDAWINCHQAVAEAHVFVTILSYGQGLFELLDRDRNGGLSSSELLAAPSILEEADALDVNGTLATSQLPHQLHVVVSRGMPARLLSGTTTRAPDWFAAMDRNQDGSISRKEFLGSEEQFTRLDKDGSRSISVLEADCQ